MIFRSKQTSKSYAKGEPIATADTDELADQLAERLNEQAHREEQDRWSA